MRKGFLIRALAAVIFAMIVAELRAAENPLRTDGAFTFAANDDNDVQPVVFQDPLANEPPASLPPFPPENIPGELPGQLPEQQLAPPHDLNAPANEELYWPDEASGYDPGMMRGPIRERFAHWQQFFAHSKPPGRFTGHGLPLTNTSWLNRPWSFGGFIGAQFHGPLVSDQLDQSNSAIGGARLGIDFDYYWGLEARFAYSNPDTFLPGVPSVVGSSHNYYVDLNLMYYPWGDSRWRPFASIGLGAGTYRFQEGNLSASDSGLRVPLTAGLKYFYSPWFTLRCDMQYSPTFGSDNFDMQNDFILSMGAEIRFGGRRQSYYPWHSGTTFW